MDLKLWLKEKIAEESAINVDEVSCDEKFDDFNMDSLSYASISFELEALIDKEISPTAFTEYNTINKLVEWIDNQN